MERAREAYFELHKFLESVGFDANKLPMKWVLGEDGRVRWGRKPEVERGDDAAVRRLDLLTLDAVVKG